MKIIIYFVSQSTFMKEENKHLEDLNKIPSGFNNNIIWNIGHVLVSEQLLAYKLSGLESTLSDKMISKYRKDSKPEGDITKEEVNEITYELEKELVSLRHNPRKMFCP